MNDWEGVVQLPPLDHSLIEKEYKKLLPLVNDKDKRRNFLGKSFVYRLTDTPTVFKSYYGDLNECKVSQSIIEM